VQPPISPLFSLLSFPPAEGMIYIFHPHSFLSPFSSWEQPRPGDPRQLEHGGDFRLHSGPALSPPFFFPSPPLREGVDEEVAFFSFLFFSMPTTRPLGLPGGSAFESSPNLRAAGPFFSLFPPLSPYAGAAENTDCPFFSFFFLFFPPLFRESEPRTAHRRPGIQV